MGQRAKLDWGTRTVSSPRVPVGWGDSGFRLQAPSRAVLPRPGSLRTGAGGGILCSHPTSGFVPAPPAVVDARRHVDAHPRAGFAPSALLPRSCVGSCQGGRGIPHCPGHGAPKGRGRRKPGRIWAERPEGAAGARPEGNGIRSSGTGPPPAPPQPEPRRAKGGRIRRPVPARVVGPRGALERVRGRGAAGPFAEGTGGTRSAAVGRDPPAEGDISPWPKTPRTNTAAT